MILEIEKSVEPERTWFHVRCDGDILSSHYTQDGAEKAFTEIVERCKGGLIGTTEILRSEVIK